MAKKLGKLAFLGIIAGAAAGTYYYFQNKNNKSDEELDDFDDFDDFDDDLEDEDFSSENQEGAASLKSHPYISIDLDNAKEKIGEKVIETLDKTKEKLEQFNVSEKLDKAKEFIGDKIAAPEQEPVYTEMDMASAQSSNEAPTAEAAFAGEVKTEAPVTESVSSVDVSSMNTASMNTAPLNTASTNAATVNTSSMNVSSTYSDDNKTSDVTENFFFN